MLTLLNYALSNELLRKRSGMYLFTFFITTRIDGYKKVENKNISYIIIPYKQTHLQELKISSHFIQIHAITFVLS